MAELSPIQALSRPVHRPRDCEERHAGILSRQERIGVRALNKKGAYDKLRLCSDKIGTACFRGPMMAKRSKKTEVVQTPGPEYGDLLAGISDLLERARRMSARAVNSIITATYWEVGRRIVEFEQGGKARAEYGKELLKRLGEDLTARHGRGFSSPSFFRMRAFYLGWDILPTASAKFEAWVRLPADMGGQGNIADTVGNIDEGSNFTDAVCAIAIAACSPALLWVRLPRFPAPWSHYVRLMSVEKPHARAFYEAEAIRGGWSVRQLDRQIGTQLYLNYIRENMLEPGENDPVGLILAREERRRGPLCHGRHQGQCLCLPLPDRLARSRNAQAGNRHDATCP